MNVTLFRLPFRQVVCLALVVAALGRVTGAQQQTTPRLVAELTLGDVANGRGVPGGFTGISRVLVGANGDIYVEQPRDNVIRHLDSSGRHLRDIGRKGQGPGETDALAGSGFLGDTLWTLDGNTGRFSLFSTRGVFHRSFRPPNIILHGPPVATLLPSHLIAGGNVLYSWVSVSSREATVREVPPLPQIIATRDSVLVDTLAMLSGFNVGRFHIRLAGDGEVYFTDSDLNQLLSTNPRAGLNSRGSWFVVVEQRECASRARYTVSRIGVRGDTLWSGTVACPRIALPRGFRDSVVAVNRDRAIGRNRLTASLAEQQVRAQMPPITAIGSVIGLHIGDDGSIWIRPMTLDRRTEEWVRVDSPAGAPSRIVLPARAQLRLVVDATRFWAVVLDADDVPTLVRYRIVQ